MARRGALSSLTVILVLALAHASYAGETAPDEAESARPKPFFLQHYTAPQLEIEAKVPQYTLPLTPEEISNWKEASRHFKCEGTAELILKNGFAVEEGWGKDLGLISSAYHNLPEGVPMFVTVDTALHIQHVLYDQLFGEIETTFMVKDLEAITAEALKWFDRAYGFQKRTAGTSAKGVAAARRNVAYFAVGARLLDPKVKVPDYVGGTALQEIRNIQKRGIAPSPIFIYDMDYGQFKPRGHYTKSEALQRYFRAMTWYAQGAFLFQGGRDMIVDAGTADIQTMQAIQIGRFFVENEDAYKKWQRMQAVLGFFAGTMDDVSVADVIRIKRSLDAELAAEPAGEPLGEAAYLARIREKLLALPPPRIHAATGIPIRREVTTPERRRKWLEQARGMRLFGQRFSFDGYAMSKLTGFTYLGSRKPLTLTSGTVVPKRGYPSPLDIMTLLGSKRAEEILREAGDAEYAHYDRELARLKTEFARLSDDDWHSNLAMCRLNLIGMLLEPVPKGYPTAMQTPAWRDRTISTGLSAWAQLKHDMILAHKEPYLGFESLPQLSWGCVEPHPMLYAELLACNEAIMKIVKSTYPELSRWPGTFTPPPTSPLGSFSRWLKWLADAATKELRQEHFDDRDREQFDSVPEDVDVILSGTQEDETRPQVVADVFTEPNEGRVLEVATGRFNLLWVVYQLPSGKKVLGAGPVMSYREFKQPMDARLTDEEWREMIDAGDAPAPPVWMKTFLRRLPRS